MRSTRQANIFPKQTFPLTQCDRLILGYPTEGLTYGVISTGVAENIIGPTSNFESTAFNTSVPTDEIPPSPTGGAVQDAAALELAFTVPSNVEEITLAYSFASEEYPAFVGTVFQDFFTAQLQLPDGSTRNIATLPNGDPITVDNAAGYVSERDGVALNKATGQLSNKVDVSDYQGQQLELTLAVADVGDQGYNSAAVIDNLSSPVFDLASQKRQLITSVRSAAAGTIGEDEAESRVDQRAEALLDDICDNALDVDENQSRRALQRMIATEEITDAATESVTGDGSPTDTIIRDLYSLTTGAALELLPEAIEGVVGGVVRSILDDAVRSIDDLAGAFRGNGIIPESSLGAIDDSLNGLKQGQASTIEEYVENNPDDAKSIVESAGGAGLSQAQSGAETAVGLLNEGRSIQDVIEELYFEGYYFDSGLPELDITPPEEIELPDINYSYDVPDESLPSELRGAVPDEISFNLETRDTELPDLPLLSQAVEILGQVGQDVSSGIDETVDDRMEFIRENIGSLAQQDAEEREEISDIISGGLSGIGDLVEEVISFLEDEVQSTLTTLSDLTTLALILCVVGAGVAVVTGVGTLGLLGVAATLSTVATYLGIATLVTDYVQVAVGQGFLMGANTVHAIGTYPLAETDLGGIDI